MRQPSNSPTDADTGSAPGRRITRRRFLAALGAAAAAVAAAAGGVALFDWFGLRTAARWYVRGVRNYARSYTWATLEPAARIARQFPYLTIDEEGLHRFVEAYERKHGKVSPKAIEANRLMYTTFLMSTDFFRNGADERKLVRYVALYDAYISPCYNPFPAPELG